jgi:cytosine/adenosine deaminase-related metal-dependent hydrolase
MMTLYRSRYVVPVTLAPLEQGGIVVEDGLIVAIGAASDLEARYPMCHQHDYGDAILLPAFINAHTHLELSHYPKWAEQWQQNNAGFVELDQHSSFTDWIIRLIEIKKNLGFNLQAYQDSWQAGLNQTIASGTGQCGDIVSLSPLTELAAKQLGGRSFIEVIGQDPDRVNQQLQQVDQCRQSWPNSHWGAAPHSPYTLSGELLKHSYRVSAAKQLRTTIHIAESADEVAFTCDSRGSIAEQMYPFVGWQQFLPEARNVRPLQLLRQVGGLTDSNVLVHGVHLNADEIKQVAAAGCSMVLCPRSNAKLNVGVAPAAHYLQAGVPLALGTDSLASNDSLSLWHEMAFALNWFSGDLDPQQLLHMCTRGGAQALYGAQTQEGQLTVGAPASFQVLQPESLPELNNIYPFLCQAQRSDELQQLVVDGVSRYIVS